MFPSAPTPYVHNMDGPKVYHNHDVGELSCIRLLSLETQAFYSSVTLRLQQPLYFHLGRPAYYFSLLFQLQSCPWEGWVSAGEEVGSDSSDRCMFMLDFHVVPLYPVENSPYSLHSEGCIKCLCVLEGKAELCWYWHWLVMCNWEALM